MTVSKLREELRKKVIQTFANQEEVYQIFFFGKEVDGTADDYSDLDMVVCSNDLAQTQAIYRKLLNDISPIRSTWVIESTPTNLSEMIMLQDYSPYQKIDFSIVNKIEDKAEFGPFVLVYECVDKSESCLSKLKVRQIESDVAHQLNVVLFSIARFTKCLFRNDFDMYRRWKSITDITLVILYEKRFGWEKESKKKLNAYEAKRFYEELGVQEKHTLAKIFPTTGKLDVALSYQASINLFCVLSKQKAKHFGRELNFAFVEYMQNFLELEIQRFRLQRVN